MRRLLKRAAPRFAKDYYHRLRGTDFHRRIRLSGEARRLVRLSEQVAGGRASDFCDLLWDSEEFRPIQLKSEIAALCEIVRELRPAAVCEIGAAGGGTTFLFSRVAPPDCLLVTVDLEFDEPRLRAVSSFARGRQRIVCVGRDSHDEETVRAVVGCLGGRSLDFLFIDGDHSRAGVARDFELYSPLVRPGGVIALHDIVPVREGDTNHHAGGVPEFWRELSDRYPSARQIIDDRGQSAFGIGVIHQGREK
ncbi:MAG: class I SAM-dependent methyltransferase [Acidobacteriota bacterium]|nr:class I SAM-dependent methyltransferase [Acidobacteriota bacterium]